MVAVGSRAASRPAAVDGESRGQNVAVGGSVLGGFAMTLCCIMPLILFSLGVTGAWIGRLSSLAQYKWYTLAFASVCLGLGYWFVYRKPKTDCAETGACARPMPKRAVKAALWFSTALVIASAAFPKVAPYFLW